MSSLNGGLRCVVMVTLLTSCAVCASDSWSNYFPFPCTLIKKCISYVLHQEACVKECARCVIWACCDSKPFCTCLYWHVSPALCAEIGFEALWATMWHGVSCVPRALCVDAIVNKVMPLYDATVVVSSAQTFSFYSKQSLFALLLSCGMREAVRVLLEYAINKRIDGLLGVRTRVSELRKIDYDSPFFHRDSTIKKMNELNQDFLKECFC